MLQILLLILPGVLCNEKDWGVKYKSPICAARGSNATLNCTFKYTSGLTVNEVKWCSVNTNSDYCHDGPYVYNSQDKSFQNNFQYIGDKSSNCSLLISNIKLTDSGDYKFRFITNTSEGKWTAKTVLKITVQDLRVSMSSSRANGSTIVGDSVNLTCSLGCPAGLADVQWFKNSYPIKESKPVLILNRVTAQDSGNYSCSLRNFNNTLSKELRIHIEGLQDVHRSLIVFITVVFSVTLFFITAVVMLRKRRKTKTHRQPMEGAENPTSHENIYQTTAETQASSVTTQQEAVNEPQEDEVQYTTVNIKAKETLLMPVEQQEDSTIYSAVLNA